MRDLTISQALAEAPAPLGQGRRRRAVGKHRGDCKHCKRVASLKPLKGGG